MGRACVWIVRKMKYGLEAGERRVRTESSFRLLPSPCSSIAVLHVAPPRADSSYPSTSEGLGRVEEVFDEPAKGLDRT